ncbi:hypothetical protein KIN20_022829 [Parelaphostrongylus tenuis]|uniref:Thioredoxin domain-containing protein n=1 Tax=Parelaphostrongylus tenuis TaxID=148309 RepID=A0AAD5N9H1_PARTN|nr:hypothetical protein KIN20_022829 [Parelaphostrongylus tenuis]
MNLLPVFTIMVASVFGEKTSKKDLSNGFPKEIDWVHFNNAADVAADLKKPIFFLIHKTWCGACKRLKQEFASFPKISDFIALSKKFVMVNVEDDDEPEDEKYAPDGAYIPRILFLDTDGEPLKTSNEVRYKNNKYFYPLIPQVIDGMERALMEFEALEEKSGEKRATEMQVESKKKRGETMKYDEDITGKEKKKEKKDKESEMKKEDTKKEKKQVKKDNKKQEL